MLSKASILKRALCANANLRTCSRSFATASYKDTFAFPTEVSTLSNGIRVATQKTFDETVTVGTWIDCGSRSESKQTNGVAHFLEHMAFKGTSNRSRTQLEKTIEDIGGHLNAYTAREQTVYYAKVMKKDLSMAVDILSDILLNSTYDKAAVEQERHVILREMEEVEKATEEVIFDRLHMTAFRDSSLGFTILGPVENINSISRNDLIDYVKINYVAEKMVVAAAGAVDHKALVDLAEKHLASVPKQAAQTISLPVDKPYFCGSELIHRNDEMGPVAHIAVGFEGVSWKSPDAVAFMVMQGIIGSYKKGEGSIVPAKISGNRTTNAIANRMSVGCAESYSAFNTCYADTGLFGFYAQCDEVAVEHCVGELMFSIGGLAYSVTEEEVNRAKLMLKTQLFGSLDSTTAIAESLGRQMIVYGRLIPVPELIARIDAINAEEVRRVAWKYLHDAEIAVAALGPLHGLPNYIQMRRQTFWHRY